MYRKNAVKILNPASDSRYSDGKQSVGWTNRKAAKRYVKQGRARFTDDTESVIIFLPTDNRHQSAIVSARQPVLASLSHLPAHLRPYIGYDRRGMMTLNEIRRIPVIQAEKLI